MIMQGYCDVYKWTILKRTSPEVKCLHPTSSRREMCTLSVSNVIYHKFSHGAAFYTLKGENVNVVLESCFSSINVQRVTTNSLELYLKSIFVTRRRRRGTIEMTLVHACVHHSVCPVLSLQLLIYLSSD